MINGKNHESLKSVPGAKSPHTHESVAPLASNRVKIADKIMRSSEYNKINNNMKSISLKIASRRENERKLVK